MTLESGVEVLEISSMTTRSEASFDRVEEKELRWEDGLDSEVVMLANIWKPDDANDANGLDGGAGFGLGGVVRKKLKTAKLGSSMPSNAMAGSVFFFISSVTIHCGNKRG